MVFSGEEGVIEEMSDYKELITLLTEFGIGFEENTDNDGNPAIFCRDGRPKVEGYHMFFTKFEFDKGYNFLKMGAWE